jgi:hypothetical protein
MYEEHVARIFVKASKSKYWEYCWSNHSFWFNNTEQQQKNNTNKILAFKLMQVQ